MEQSRKKPKALALSQREKKLVAGLAQGLNKREAAVRAGYAATTAAKKVTSILRRPLIATALTKALEREGVTLGRVVKPIVDALKANVVTTFQGRAFESDVPDHRTRLEASELAISLHGGLPKQVELPPAPQEPLTVIIEAPDGTTTGIHLGGRTEGTASPPPPAR